MKKNLIYGIHPILEALDAGKEFDKIFMKRGLRTEETLQIISITKKRLIPVMFVPEEKLNRITMKNHQGVVAFLSDIEYANLEMLIPALFEEGKMPFIILLDGITDVRNFGAIARSAECAGADAIVIPERGSVSVTADAIKTSAGALSRIPVCRVSTIPAAISLLRNSGIKVIAASEKSSTMYTDECLLPPVGIVMGAEDVGPSEQTLRMADSIVAIPQKGSIGSLNVSVAAGIMLYEVLRQETLDN
ncbi:23S rRNA (guanosine(2251)-2'-O)-methyltransferase RlmB [Porphyromonas macacae]|uniref:23S rRNA (guanosine(2251)-2'-O)-methyltransferase RlmB n=1 Tax=Porphyromonas macacae TaxID=28115 RepID=UPI0024AD508C|nr:23S rRNA (guanosine(2251)-2'-O)-methyltransferase RlmB [Porphyromonas macacae]